MADLDTFYLKTAEQIRDDMLRTYANSLIRRGITNPNVSFGTEIYVKFSAIANQLAVGMSNTQLMADALMPDSAQGSDLERIAAVYRLSLRPAGGSTGGIILATPATSAILIPVGSQLTDPVGLSYQVTVGGSYSNGDRIPIASIATGAATNLAAGTVLKWASPPPFVSQLAPVAPGGLTLGVDTETYEGLRTRVLERIRNPPASGNWSHVNATAEDSTVAVQKSFCYAAANGPATVHTAVTAAPTATNKNRDLDSLVLSTVVTPAIAALLPEFSELVSTTVQNEPTTLALGLSLPASKSASPAGPGGGWLDGTPFPTYAADGLSSVVAVTSSTVFTVTSDLPPQAGVSRISWLSPLDWKLYLGKVVSYSGSGPWVITIDTPFVGITDDHIISPQAQNSATYFAALLNAFAKLGPGQKTVAAGVLPRAYRKPLVSESWPSDLNAQFLSLFRAGVGSEVADYAINYASPDTPTIPALITDAPYVLIPQNLGIYPL